MKNKSKQNRQAYVVLPLAFVEIDLYMYSADSIAGHYRVVDVSWLKDQNPWAYGTYRGDKKEGWVYSLNSINSNSSVYSTYEECAEACRKHYQRFISGCRFLEKV